MAVLVINDLAMLIRAIMCSIVYFLLLRSVSHEKRVVSSYHMSAYEEEV